MTISKNIKPIRKMLSKWKRTHFKEKTDPRITIGEFTYGEPEVSQWDEDAILKIGKFCSIAANVNILMGGDHPIDWVTTYPFNIIFDEFNYISGSPISKGDVIIGNDVWIGKGALILSGVAIGDGAIIGAHSVVTKNVEPYAIVAGNPASQIRKRFSDSIIEELLSIRWWDWNLEKINENIPLMLSPDIQVFIDKNAL